MKRIAIVLGLVIGLASCVQTSVTSFTAPEFAGYEADRIVVYAHGMPLRERLSAESSMAEELTVNGVQAVRAVDLIPPTTADPGALKLIEAVQQSGITTVLRLAVAGLGSNTGYAPLVTTPSTSTSRLNVFGNTATVDTTTTPGVTFGGFAYEIPIGIYDAVLIDFATEKIMWRAEADATGYANAPYEELTKAVAKKIVRQMKEDDLLPKAPE